MSSGVILRNARTSARLSQADVARRCGVAQSVISAYESGRREPSVETLGRLVEATGHQLVLDVVAMPGRTLGLPDTPLGRRIRQRRVAIVEAAAKRRARDVRVFGSVARGEDTASSDVDLLVDLEEGVSLVALAGLKRELSDVLGVDVDVVPASALKAALRDEVFAEAIPL